MYTWKFYPHLFVFLFSLNQICSVFDLPVSYFTLFVWSAETSLGIATSVKSVCMCIYIYVYTYLYKKLQVDKNIYYIFYIYIFEFLSICRFFSLNVISILLIEQRSPFYRCVKRPNVGSWSRPMMDLGAELWYLDFQTLMWLIQLCMLCDREFFKSYFHFF